MYDEGRYFEYFALSAASHKVSRESLGIYHMEPSNCDVLLL